MSNREKISSRLDSLYIRHRELDNRIRLCYNKFTKDEEIKKLKSEKLQLKDEIYKLENEIKE